MTDHLQKYLEDNKEDMSKMFSLNPHDRLLAAIQNAIEIEASKGIDYSKERIEVKVEFRNNSAIVNATKVNK